MGYKEHIGTSNDLYFRCKYCNAEVPWPENRLSRFCSKACKQKAYRERVKEAAKAERSG